MANRKIENNTDGRRAFSAVERQLVDGFPGIGIAKGTVNGDGGCC